MVCETGADGFIGARQCLSAGAGWNNDIIRAGREGRGVLWLIRAGAYALSGIILWHVFQDGPPPVAHRLALDPDNALIFGVCAGLSNYTGFDVTLIRLAWALLAFYRGVGVFLYLLAFLLMP